MHDKCLLLLLINTFSKLLTKLKLIPLMPLPLSVRFFSQKSARVKMFFSIPKSNYFSLLEFSTTKLFIQKLFIAKFNFFRNLFIKFRVLLLIVSRKFSVKGNDNTITGDGCSFTSKNNGEYSVNFKLDKCGTTVTQNGDKIVFSNSVTGNTDALTIQVRVLIVLSLNS